MFVFAKISIGIFLVRKNKYRNVPSSQNKNISKRKKVFQKDLSVTLDSQAGVTSRISVSQFTAFDSTYIDPKKSPLFHRQLTKKANKASPMGVTN